MECDGLQKNRKVQMAGKRKMPILAALPIAASVLARQVGRRPRAQRRLGYGTRRRQQNRRRLTNAVTKSFPWMAHIMGKTNRNSKQRSAFIDQMNGNQMRAVGSAVRDFLYDKVPRNPKLQKKLFPYRKVMAKIMRSGLSLQQKKKLLKQNGGFLNLLAGAVGAPLMKSVAEPLVKSVAAPLLSGLVGKLIK